MRPRSVKKEIPVEFIGLSVSKAKGWNACEGGSDEYFADFLAAACSAAPPDCRQHEIGLRQCIDYSDIPCHCFASVPRNQSAAVQTALTRMGRWPCTKPAR